MTFTVLESAEPPNDQTNPYLPLLVRSFPPTVRTSWFSWRQALVGGFDVFHLHWPEVRIRGRTPGRSAARRLLFLLLLLRIRITGRALVRTVHNVAPHDALPASARALMRLCDRWTTLWITLSELAVPPSSAPVVVAPHGHYRDWFESLPRSEVIPGRLLHVGLLRRYKGLDSLLEAFADLQADDVTLRIVGKVIDDTVAIEIAAARAEDQRVTSVHDYVSDEELVREVTASEIVVLPFRTVTNSGSLLLALSLGRPVLVPSGPMSGQIAAEVGPGWVMTYEPPLEADDLVRALALVRGQVRAPEPDLSRRGWDSIGQIHADAFGTAMSIARGRARRPART